MDPRAVLIPVRSQRQAMDWSLVLVSQGIETAIEHSETAGGWALAVSPEDYERALAAIRQYRAENRGWPWQRALLLPEFVFDAGSVVWAILLALFYWLMAAVPRLQDAGLMDNAAVSRGAWWRPFTAVVLHHDVGHLATNLAFGLLLLGLAMGRFGTGIGVLAAYLAGVGGNVAVWLLCQPAHRSLGASGMVMGALGLLAGQSFALWKRPHGSRHVLAGVVGGVFLFILFGVAPGTDTVAHAGGFAAGLLFGMGLSRGPALARNGRANLLAGILFAALVMLSWWAALR